MDASARNQYLDAEIMSATPQKLHLLLIEAIIRTIHRGKHHWQSGEDDKGLAALCHAQRMVCEILGGFDREVNPDLVRRMAELYLYVYRTLVDGNRRHDEKKLDEALRVLEIERGTWQAVCEKLGTAGEVASGREVVIDPPTRGVSGPSRHQGLPLSEPSPPDSLSSQGFSWEA
jgi:flagellar protein FliS